MNKTRFQKVLEIIRQEFGITGDKAERAARTIINVLEYKKRSAKENNYYWGVVVEITAEYFGYTPQEMHDAWKHMFLIDETPGRPPRIRSTADEKFTTLDAEKYYERIRAYMAVEHGFVIPLPNEKI